MIAIYVKLIFAAAILLAQPIQREYDRGHVRNGVVATRSNHASSIPAQRSSKAVARREIPIRGDGSKPQANATGVSDTAREKTADTHSIAGAGVNSDTRTIQEQVMAATAVAEHVFVATAVQAADQKASPTSPNHANRLVAILMARTEIKSVSDLTGKNIAIDDRQSASDDNVRTAIVAAGATEVQLSRSQTKSIDRLISGEVPAAVLTLVSPDAAEGFPDIAGFKVLRIPLPQPATSTTADSDTTRANTADSRAIGGAVANSTTRTIQEQVAAARAVAEQMTVTTLVPAPEPKANDKDRSDHSETVLRGDLEKTAPPQPNKTNLLIYLLMARPEIKSVSDLTSKIIAIDDGHTGFEGNVRIAIAAAGAPEVQLSNSQTKAIDRVIS